MWTSFIAVVSFLSYFGKTLAAPAAYAVPSPAPTTPARLEERQGNLAGVLGAAVSDLNNVFSDVASGSLGGTAAWSSIKSALQPVTATATQTNAASAISSLSAIHSAQPSANLYEFLASIVAEGLTTDSVADALSFVDGVLSGDNSMNNV